MKPEIYTPRVKAFKHLSTLAVALAADSWTCVTINKLLVYLQTLHCLVLWIQTLFVKKCGNIPSIISGVIYEIQDRFR